MASEWRERTLGELTENFDGVRIPVKEADRRSGPYPYYGASGIVDYVDGFLLDGDYLLIAEDGENLRTRTTPIAFLARGKFWVNNHAHIVRGNGEADTRFLMYSLAATDISGYLTGSTMPKLTQGNMNRIPLLAPTLPEQRAIARILGTLDDKIELNRQTSETLEEIARALFKSWFVDFDPVRAKAEGRDSGLPKPLADLFPARLVASELGEIPEGWVTRTIADVCSIVTRGVTPMYAEGSGRYIINQRTNRGAYLDLSELKELDPELNVPADCFAQYWDVLVNCLGEGTLGRVHLYKGKSAIYAVDQHMSICRGRTSGIGAYLYQVLASPGGQEKIEGLKTGSTGMTMFNISKLRGFSFLWPGDPLIAAYFRLVEPALNRIMNSEEQSRTLAALRDTLLPKLVSGELSVKDTEKIVGMVV